MDKKTLARFAPAERIYLRTAVEKRLKSFGLNKDGLPNFNDWLSVDGSFIVINQKRYPKTVLQSFKGLYNEYKKVGYDQLVEELAYTWFNRFMAIRYMEVNGVLPDYVKIIERDSITRRPEIMDNYEHLKVNKEEIEELKHNNQEEEAYRKLFLASVNKLGEVMPFLFERLQDWTELVLPDKILEPNGLIDRILTEEGLTESFKDGVESIGWMYQYYIAELKNVVMKKKKTSKEELPARTQLFTPKWIVKYLVENSLGQLWLEAEEKTTLASKWDYFVEPVEQTTEVQEHLRKISYKNIELESITVLDPACGSGHILSYAYDLLFDMYLERGYSKRDIPELILTHNLYGIDIDLRAAQLAYFTLMMKAVESAGRVVWRNPIEPHIIAIQESNGIDLAFLELALEDNTDILVEVKSLLKEFTDAKEYGSLLQPSSINIELIKSALNKENYSQEEMFNIANKQSYENQFLQILIQQHNMLNAQYDVVITNPPYMGNSSMSLGLDKFAKSRYPLSKGDLFAMFMERNSNFVKENGFVATINQHSWMFLTTFEKLRKKVLSESIISSMLHLGPRTFEDIGGEVVQSTAYITREVKEFEFKGLYYRLVKASNSAEKEMEMLRKNTKHIYSPQVSDFLKIPGSPIAYWADEAVYKAFKNNKSLNEIADVRQGLATTNNDLFLRYWWEVSYSKIGFQMKNAVEAKKSKKKWFPFNKGGEFRKWYGNIEHVINWEKDGEEIKEFTAKKYTNYTRTLKNLNYMFRDGVTWSAISSNRLAVRYQPQGVLFSNAGMTVFSNSEEKNLNIIGLLNSGLIWMLIQNLSSTINFDAGIIKRLPYKELNQESNLLIKRLIQISREEWDTKEISYSFVGIQYRNSDNLRGFVSSQQEQLSKWKNEMLINEDIIDKELNRLFEVSEEKGINKQKEVEKTIRPLSTLQAVKEFLSYFIGCTIGRFSLDKARVIYSNSENDNSLSYQPIKDAILTFTDEQILPDKQDVYKLLQKFLKIVFSEETLEENLVYIASALGKKPNEPIEQTIRRYFLTEYIKDHIQLYKKRPIYWLIDSGKQKGMQSLIYMHRYTPYTLGLAMQNHFVPLLSQWRNLEQVTLEEMENGDITPAVKKELTKKLDVYKKRRVELEAFQDKLNYFARQEIPIDLDDGVKVNYQKFNGILKEIKF